MGRALAVLPFDARPRTTRLTEARFAELACESKAARVFDWKLTNEAVLDALANQVAPARYMDFAVEGDTLRVFRVAEGATVAERVIPRDAARDALLCAFVAVAGTGESVLAIRHFDDSDTSAYLILGASQARALEEALGRELCAGLFRALA